MYNSMLPHVLERIVTGHQGRLRVASQVGTGTTVFVSLPVSEKGELSHD
jgi:signal transduction histidine kinase